MKKIVVSLSILLFISLFAIIAVFSVVNFERNRITFKENEIYGDSRYAFGAVISASYEHSDNLFWETSIKLGSDLDVDNEYDFKYRNTNVYKPVYSGITPNSNFYYDIRPTGEASFGLTLAFKQLYDQTPAGTERSYTVKISDYYDYYPISVGINLPNWNYGSFLNYDDLSTQNSEAKETVLASFNDFFKIPIMEGDTIGITVDKDESDGFASNTVHTNCYTMYSDCVLGESTCYIYINNRGNNNKLVDTSLIPGGYGIYAIEYGNEYQYKMDLDSLRTVFSLPENEAVKDVKLYEEKGFLFVFTETNEKSYLYSIDADSYALIDKLELQLPKFHYVWAEESFFMVKADETLEVISVFENGTLKSEFTATSNYYVNPSFHSIHTSASVDFDGEYLICADFLHEGRFKALELCSFYVSVFSKDGLVYYGEYDCSLSANPNASNYSYNCLPNTDEYLVVSWN